MLDCRDPGSRGATERRDHSGYLTIMQEKSDGMSHRSSGRMARLTIISYSARNVGFVIPRANPCVQVPGPWHNHNCIP